MFRAGESPRPRPQRGFYITWALSFNLKIHFTALVSRVIVSPSLFLGQRPRAFRSGSGQASTARVPPRRPYRHGLCTTCPPGLNSREPSPATKVFSTFPRSSDESSPDSSCLIFFNNSLLQVFVLSSSDLLILYAPPPIDATMMCGTSSQWSAVLAL